MRHPDWHHRLAAAVAEREAAPFIYGAHDCCLAPCDLVLAMTGIDPAAPFRGRYRTAAGAYAVLRRHAGEKGLGRDAALERTVERVFADCGFAEVAPLRAQRGDLALLAVLGPNGVGLALGLVDLDGRLLVAGWPGGWRRGPLRGARRAWRVA